ncbi:54S ribosomal protein L39, mitochondrial [Borealophlyctis nickersoniae]|nr:54S ribosomal protein L39, mitochondrial [Borealophlyctis nickersoniae]
MQEGGFYYDALLKKGVSEWVGQRLEMARHAEENADAERELMDERRMNEDITTLLRTDPNAIYNVTEPDMAELYTLMKGYVASRKPFERLEVNRSLAARMFATNPFKLFFLSRVPPLAPVTLYKCGDFVDLCRGPHVGSTKQIAALKLLRTGGAQWDAAEDGTRQPLSRVYGIGFSVPGELKRWEENQEAATRRDHRVVGKAQQLFTMHPLSPGSPFFLPHGTRVAVKLMDFLRQEYRRYGYREVITPQLFNKELWETSGHWQNYKEDMFVIGDGAKTDEKTERGCCGGHAEAQSEGEIHGLKPMNCPGHCLIFASGAHSYRDLPVRLAEFSPLHRNEASGALTGLTRVRKFHQDDAHIFCTPEQIPTEISSTLSFIDRVYNTLRFPSYDLTLSTRPESSYMGTIEQWDQAESALRSALDSTGREWTIKPGDGAFYGPKIDIMVRDALGRAHQTATIQLDFQLPQRFGLKYQDETGGYKVPVIIHRAALGSVERMMAVLIEQWDGRWPVWLSPRQACVLSLGDKSLAWAKEVTMLLGGEGYHPPVSSSSSSSVPTPSPSFFHVDLDASDRSLGKKVREARLARYNYVLVVGEKEVEARNVMVRHADGKEVGWMGVEEVRSFFKGMEDRYE